MNLLVNKLLTEKTGLALALTLFLFSCSDPNDIGSDLDPNLSRTELRVVELPIESSVVLQDSVRSYGAGRLLVGRHNDPTFGNIYSEAYAHILPITKNPTIANDVIFDSLVLTLRLNKPQYIYGEDISSPQTISVYQLTDTLSNRISELYSFKKKAYSNEPWGKKTFTLNPERDSVLHIRLKDELGSQWLNSAVSKDGTFATDTSFLLAVKGIALVPGENNNYVLGAIPVTTDTLIRLYYHSNSDTNSINFRLATPYQNYIEVDRNGTPLTNLLATEELITNEYVYTQGGTGVITKLNLGSYKNFLDTVGNISITRADLEIGEILNEGAYKTKPSAISFFYADTLFNLISRQYTTGDHYSAPVSETSDTPLTLIYSSTFNKYKAEITRHLVGLRRATNNQAFSMMLYPGNSGNEVARGTQEQGLHAALIDFRGRFDQLVIPKNQIKLKIYYTKLK